MADLINIPLGTFKKAFLASPINGVQQEQIVLDAVLDIEFDGTTQYLSILDPDSPELISFTGQTDTGELTGVTRGLPLKKGGDSSAASHSANISVALSNPHQIFENIQNAMNSKLDESGGVLEGKLEFTGAENPGLRVAVLTDEQKNALANLENGHIVFVTDPAEGEGNLQFYGNGVWTTLSEGGAFINATENVGGKVELATIADQQAQTELGDNGSPLVMQAKNTTSTSAGADDAGKALLLNGDGLVDNSAIATEIKDPSIFPAYIPYLDVNIENVAANLKPTVVTGAQRLGANVGTSFEIYEELLVNKTLRGIPAYRVYERMTAWNHNDNMFGNATFGYATGNDGIANVDFAERINIPNGTLNVRNLKIHISYFHNEVTNGGPPYDEDIDLEVFYLPIDENGQYFKENAFEIFNTHIATDSGNLRRDLAFTIGDRVIKNGDMITFRYYGKTESARRKLETISGLIGNLFIPNRALNDLNPENNVGNPEFTFNPAVNPIPRLNHWFTGIIDGEEGKLLSEAQLMPVTLGSGNKALNRNSGHDLDVNKSLDLVGFVDSVNEDRTLNIKNYGRYRLDNTFVPGEKLYITQSYTLNVDNISGLFKTKKDLSNIGSSIETEVGVLTGYNPAAPSKENFAIEVGYVIDNEYIFIDIKPAMFRFTNEVSSFATNSNTTVDIAEEDIPQGVRVVTATSATHDFPENNIYNTVSGGSRTDGLAFITLTT
jgi:hypothetical protein